MVSVCEIRGRGCIFVFNTDGSKSHVKKISQVPWKSFGDSAKNRYFLRLHNNSRNMFGNACEGNCLSYLSNNVVETCYIGLKFQGTWKSSIFRSTPPEMFLGKVVLKICSKVTGEHP